MDIYGWFHSTFWFSIATCETTFGPQRVLPGRAQPGSDYLIVGDWGWSCLDGLNSDIPHIPLICMWYINESTHSYIPNINMYVVYACLCVVYGMLCMLFFGISCWFYRMFWGIHGYWLRLDAWPINLMTLFHGSLSVYHEVPVRKTQMNGSWLKWIHHDQ